MTAVQFCMASRAQTPGGRLVDAQQYRTVSGGSRMRSMLELRRSDPTRTFWGNPSVLASGEQIADSVALSTGAAATHGHATQAPAGRRRVRHLGLARCPMSSRPRSISRMRTPAILQRVLEAQ